MADLTPYATAKPFFGVLETWLPDTDAQRIASYALYEGIYRNVPESFKLVQRGSDAFPIYIPSAKTIIEAKNRFLAKRWTYALDPRMGGDGDRLAVNVALTNLFRREQVWTKFGTQKRWGMVRGDSVWHVVADAAKLAGKRLSIYEVDPAAYFPIDDPFNPDKISGVHLAEPVLNEESGATIIKRQTYRKTESGTISYELSWWEVGAWDDREGSGQELKKAAGKDIPQGDTNKPVTYELPSTITSLPVYHVKNARVPNAPFGTSDLEGFERLMGGVNQAISDEELTLALEGLGLYATTSGPPVDENKAEINWILGPGRVVEHDQDTDFKRVNGVSSVAPFLDHIRFIQGAMREAAGVPDIAIGSVDVNTAESGIALAFKMSPLLAANEEKELEILSKMDHMLYDLVNMWLPTFEQIQPNGVSAVSVVDDPMPVNRQAIIDEVVALMSTDPPLMSAEYARQYLSEKLGFEFALTMGDAIVAEQTAYAAARNADPYAARVEQELQEGA